MSTAVCRAVVHNTFITAVDCDASPPQLRRSRSEGQLACISGEGVSSIPLEVWQQRAKAAAKKQDVCIAQRAWQSRVTTAVTHACKRDPQDATETTKHDQGFGPRSGQGAATAPHNDDTKKVCTEKAMHGSGPWHRLVGEGASDLRCAAGVGAQERGSVKGYSAENAKMPWPGHPGGAAVAGSMDYMGGVQGYSTQKAKMPWPGHPASAAVVGSMDYMGGVKGYSADNAKMPWPGHSASVAVAESMDYMGGVKGYSTENTKMPWSGHPASTAVAESMDYAGGVKGCSADNAKMPWLGHPASAAVAESMDYMGGVKGYSTENATMPWPGHSGSAAVAGSMDYMGGVKGCSADNAKMPWLGHPASATVAGSMDYTCGVKGYSTENATMPWPGHSASATVAESMDYMGGVKGYSTENAKMPWPGHSASAAVGESIDYAGGVQGYSANNAKMPLPGHPASATVAGSMDYMGGVKGYSAENATMPWPGHSASAAVAESMDYMGGVKGYSAENAKMPWLGHPASAAVAGSMDCMGGVKGCSADNAKMPWPEGSGNAARVWGPAEGAGSQDESLLSSQGGSQDAACTRQEGVAVLLPRQAFQFGQAREDDSGMRSVSWPTNQGLSLQASPQALSSVKDAVADAFGMHAEARRSVARASTWPMPEDDGPSPPPFSPRLPDSLRDTPGAEGVVDNAAVLQADPVPEGLADLDADSASAQVLIQRARVDTNMSLRTLKRMYRRGSLQSIPRDDHGRFTSVGTAGHLTGDCRPCILWFAQRCTKSILCTYCHIAHSSQTHKRYRPSKRIREAQAMRASYQ